MEKVNNLTEETWVDRLSAAIVYQAFQDYVQGLMCCYDSMCAPANVSMSFAEYLVKDAMQFFESSYCHDLTDLDCVTLAHQLKSHVPEFVERLRKAVPQLNPETKEEEAFFKCPNCGANVRVKWVSKPSKIIKGSCAGCMFHSIYRLPLEKHEKMGW